MHGTILISGKFIVLSLTINPQNYGEYYKILVIAINIVIVDKRNNIGVSQLLTTHMLYYKEQKIDNNFMCLFC